MRKEKKLALEVKELANEFTHWDFQIQQDGDSYLVGTTLSNKEGVNMTIYYLIGEKDAQLSVSCSNCSYDDDFVDKKINTQRFPVYAVGMGKSSISFNSPMTFHELDNNMYAIVCGRMVAMMEAVTEIVNRKAG